MDRSDPKRIERAVMADHNRPCLYGVAGPCQHPNCLEAHFLTLSAAPPPPAEQASGELSHAIDLMRDVYMSKAQRESYERILAAALSQRPVVDEAMVERATRAYYEAHAQGAVAFQTAIRAALTAALAPQQPTGEEE